MDVEGDRLSSLPDDLIHKIFSSVDIRDVIGTSGFSSRWRFIWTSMPYLNFSTEVFYRFFKFSKFATKVWSHRDNLTQVYSLRLSGRVLDNDIEFPLSLFSSQSLKILSLNMLLPDFRYHHILTSTWELPELTTLELRRVNLSVDGDDKYVDIFSNFVNLKNLTLNDVSTKGSNCLSIIHPRLCSLTLEHCCWCSAKDFNVVAPQLKNLTIKCCPGKHAVSAPELTSLVYIGSYPLGISTVGFHSLEKADICLYCLGGQDKDACQVISLLQLLHNVQFLTLDLEIVEFLSSSTDLILPQPSPFVNLKSLKIHPEILGWGRAHKEVTTLSPKLKSYFLDSSPGSTFTMILRKEVKVQKMMAELGVILEKEKNYIITNMAHVEQGKVYVESNKAKAKMNWKTELIKSGWENLDVQLQQRKEKACLIISKMQDIEELVTKLPASNRAKIQPCFFSLCAEVDNVISQIADRMKMQCDEI